MSEAERCDAQLNIPLCGRALRSGTHDQSKRSANVPLTLNQTKSRSDHALTLNVSSNVRPIYFFPFYSEILLNKCLNYTVMFQGEIVHYN